MANVARQKDSFPRSPTKNDMEALPVLGSLPLGPTAPYILSNAQVSQTWDDDETIPEGFSDYCTRRLRQYGLPFVGLSSALEREDPHASEWNRRTLAFCVDTFHHLSTVAGEYENFFRVDRDEIDTLRMEELMKKHLDYRISNKRIHTKKADAISDHQQYNRRKARCGRVRSMSYDLSSKKATRLMHCFKCSWLCAGWRLASPSLVCCHTKICSGMSVCARVTNRMKILWKRIEFGTLPFIVLIWQPCWLSMWMICIGYSDITKSQRDLEENLRSV